MISCILTVYNSEEYLEAAISSVLSQTLKNFELIVVDDGSTDRTAEILKDFSAADPRVVVLRQSNAGPYAVASVGLRIARPRYTAQMDTDDVALPERFAFQADYLVSG